MANIRLMPPAAGATNSPANGRSYTCAVGSTLDVPDFDAFILTANGWTPVAGSVGATTARPLNPSKNQTFHDSTLGYVIVWDGAKWRNPATGAAV